MNKPTYKPCTCPGVTDSWGKPFPHKRWSKGCHAVLHGNHSLDMRFDHETLCNCCCTHCNVQAAEEFATKYEAERERRLDNLERMA